MSTPPNPVSPSPGDSDLPLPPSGTERLRGALRNFVRALRIAWEVHPAATGGLIGVALLGAFLPASEAWVGKLVVDAVVQALAAPGEPMADLRTISPLLLMGFGLLLAGVALAETRTLLQHVLATHLRFRLSADLIRKAIDLELRQFESAFFYDRLQNARRETDFRTLTLLDSSFSVVQGAIVLISLAAVLLTFSPLVALVLFGATLPSFITQARYGEARFLLHTWRVPELRRMNYLSELLTTDAAAKEVKLFGLGKPLLARYRDLFWKFYKEDSGLARRRAFLSLGWGLVSALSFYASYVWILWRALTGTITLGDLTLFLAVFRHAQGTIQSIFLGFSQIYEGSLFLQNLFGFLDTPAPWAERGRPVPRPIACGFELRDVSFRYPGQTAWALRHVDLRIGPGETLALVGLNGAGKTTLVKLLARLYEPTEGQILLDGIDLRELDRVELWARIGVIFQDFVRYQATVRENIGFGQIDRLGDTEKVREASRLGGADEVVASLSEGLETTLGHWFEGGRELSGGQWQKVASARAFMRDCEILVLDEPTAALDPEREAEIFQRFRRLTEGKIALLISHRFSTVRMADRIATLENGRVTETGTHRELLERDGTYARLFRLQAEAYQ